MKVFKSRYCRFHYVLIHALCKTIWCIHVFMFVEKICIHVC